MIANGSAMNVAAGPAISHGGDGSLPPSAAWMFRAEPVWRI